MDQGEIKRKNISKEYTLVRNSNKRLKPEVWETVYCIKDQDDSIMDNYVACTKCNLVLNQSKDGSTKNLLTHIEKCSGMKSSTKNVSRKGEIAMRHHCMDLKFEIFIFKVNCSLETVITGYFLSSNSRHHIINVGFQYLIYLKF
jgi:hypothetical protein